MVFPSDAGETPCALIELVLRLGPRLIGPDPAKGDVRAVVAFAFHRRAVQPAEEGQLPCVRERVGDGPLKQARRGVVLVAKLVRIL